MRRLGWMFVVVVTMLTLASHATVTRANDGVAAMRRLAGPTIDGLERDFGIAVGPIPDQYRVHVAKPLGRGDEREFVTTIRLADEELRRCDPAFLANAGIAKLVFVKDLYSGDVAQTITYNVRTNALLFDVAACQRNPSGDRSAIDVRSERG